MTEELLQFIWQFQLYRPGTFISSQNEEVEVVHPGQLNGDAGPDFFNAKIKVDGIVLAGNVEVHHSSSDWNKHNHHTNEAYNNVILHVVLENDTDVLNQKGQKVSAIEISIHQGLVSKYNDLLKNQQWITCADGIVQMNQIEVVNWLERLAIMKLEEKCGAIENIVGVFDGNWDQVFFVVLSRAMGFGLNGDAFERMARNTPVKALLQHADNLFQVEAVLFGQAGLLKASVEDDYYKRLLAEYQFLKAKFNLSEPDVNSCRFLRLRPQNFPTIRMAQLANFICQSRGVFDFIFKPVQLDVLLKKLDFNTSEYWTNHYVFGKEGKKDKERSLGINSKKLLIINAIAPFLFAYGKYKGDNVLQSYAIELLSSLSPEKNSIVKQWQDNTKIDIKSAFETQGLIYLRNNFCNLKKCLSCVIGHKVLNKVVN